MEEHFLSVVEQLYVKLLDVPLERARVQENERGRCVVDRVFDH